MPNQRFTIMRCSKCVLPETMPDIRFDDKGVCNYCRTYKNIKYKGENALLVTLEKARKSTGKYNCIVNISGGRDSSYAILKMAKDYQMKVLAVNYQNPFTHPQAAKNIKNIQQILGVKLVGFSFKPGFHQKILKYNLQTLLRKPDPALVPIVCISCKLIWKNILDIARSYNVNLIISGGNLYEQTTFKRVMLGGNQNQSLRSYYTKYGFGLARHALSNIYFLRPQTLLPTIKGYLYSNPYSPMVQLKGRKIAKIDLFHYLQWNENEVVGRIKNELGWQLPDAYTDSWRFDCEISHLKDFLYMKMLGLTEKDDFYSKLIREGMITRKKALERIEDIVDEDPIKNILQKIGLDSSIFDNLNRYSL